MARRLIDPKCGRDAERWFPNGPEDANVTLIRLDADHADWWTGEGDGNADLRQSVATS